MALHLKSRLITFALGAAWLIAVGAGLYVLLNYEAAAGSVGAVPAKWPIGSAIRHSNGQMTLVMLAHPRCPCTRATIGELAQIMAGAQGKVQAYVLFFRPKEGSADWDDSDLRRSAAAIPGVVVQPDIDAAEARRFGGETSGHTLLFDRSGKLVFSGGITQSRGHAGGNNGESAIVALLNGEAADRTETPVFGCPISEHVPRVLGVACPK